MCEGCKGRLLLTPLYFPDTLVNWVNPDTCLSYFLVRQKSFARVNLSVSSHLLLKTILAFKRSFWPEEAATSKANRMSFR